MRTFSIEIDADVYAYLKSRLQEFGDTPNTILRRELFIKQQPGRRATSTSINLSDSPLVACPFGTVAALEKTLQVAALVRSGMPRSAATNRVASARRITPQSVLDAYTRQLQLTAAQFDRLLAQDGLHDLRSLLKKRFSDHNLIDTVLAGPPQSPEN